MSCGRARFSSSGGFDNPKMQFVWATVVEEIRGNGAVNGVVLKNLKTGEVSERETEGVFIYIGFHPINDFMRGIVDLDNAGHVVTDLQMQTSVPGVFAGGATSGRSRTASSPTAVGDGVSAALSAYRYLEG